MDLTKALTDNAILSEIGKRLAKQRLDKNLTQAQLSEMAGISKRTLERIEAGRSTQLTNFIRVLRSLDLISAMDSFLPKNKPGPIELMKNKDSARKRANPKRDHIRPDTQWSWGDEP